MQRFLYSLKRTPQMVVRCFGTNISMGTGTIYACSSGTGPAGVAVIRISGPDSAKVLKLMTSADTLPNPREMVYKKIIHPVTKETIDRGFVVWFPAPRSFTGEDCTELQVHGGNAVINAIFKALACIDNVRYAEAGEFTKRAFFHSKFDLTAAEGIADLIHAETEMQRKQAFLQSQGSLRQKYDSWKDILLDAMANLEAMIEFSETDGISEDPLDKLTTDITRLRDEIKAHTDDCFRGERLRGGVKTVVIGSPNVGKSSLVNKLCKRTISIVSDIENTTRDVVEIPIDIGGYAVLLADTAGLEDKPSGALEVLAQKSSIKYFENAGLVLFVIDVTAVSINFDDIITYIKNFVPNGKTLNLVNKAANNFADLFIKPCIVVLNKTDLVGEVLIPDDVKKLANVTFVSCKNEDGLKELKEAMAAKLTEICGVPTMENPSLNNERHKLFLTPVCANLTEFLIKTQIPNIPCDLLAEDLRLAIKAIGGLTGQFSNEQVLNLVFSKFCIGK